MKLKWLEIERFRNVAPGTRLEFDDRFNVVLGRNGTGKTTLLRLIEAVAHGSYHGLEDEELSIAACLMVGDGSLLVRLESSPSTVSNLRRVEETLGRQMAPTWTYELEQRTSSGTSWSLRSTPSQSTLVTSDGSTMGRPISPFSEHSFWSALTPLLDAERAHLIDPILAAVARDSGGVARFDESLGTFTRILDRVSPERIQIGVVHTKEGVGHQWRQGFIPDGLLPRRWPDSQTVGGAVFEVLHHDSEPLGLIAETLGFHGLAMRFTMSSSVVKPDGSREVIYESPAFQVGISDKLTVSHEQLSFGQKRMLSFIYYLETSAGPVIADELVNGMHHSWIGDCLSLLEKRGLQAFLTSQNPLLLDYLEFESAEEAQRAFVLCELDGDTFVWRQMSDDEARRFYLAYEVGVQHVGDILRTKGLW